MVEATPPVSQALPLVARLLAWAAGPQDAPAVCLGSGWEAGGEGQRQLQWALDGGLGPLLHRATQGSDATGSPLPSPWRETLLAADLSARVRHGNLVDTLLAVLSRCRVLGLVPTLLKGVSVSEQWYPQEHLRPMGDIDLLLDAADYDRVEAALLANGCERIDEPASPSLQHGIPLRDSERDTLIELHTRLFSLDAELSTGSLFGAASLARQVRPSHCHGQPVQRLSAELQLAYIASSWFNDMTTYRVHPSFLASLFDAVYLLKAAGPTLDWPGLIASLDNPLAAASLHVMLSYLPRHGVRGLPAGLATSLAGRQSLVGPLQLGLIHHMLDSHLVAGRPWTSRLPPPVPGRYSLTRQWRKRVLHRH